MLTACETGKRKHSCRWMNCEKASLCLTTAIFSQTHDLELAFQTDFNLCIYSQLYSIQISKKEDLIDTEHVI